MVQATLKRAVWVVLATLVIAGMSSFCSAAMIIGDPQPLSNLTTDSEAELIVGDKRFSMFEYTATGEMPGAANVNIIPIQDDMGNFGFRLQGLFMDLASSQGGSDALLTYKVEVLSTFPNRLISDAHLQGNPTLGEERAGFVGVTEVFLPLGENGEYTMTISDDEAKETAKLIDWVFFVPPVRSLMVQKDIGALAVAGNDSPNMSFVDQTFSQTEIPEPATVGLLLSGVVMLGLARRRRRW
jgi:hypothetical protein